MSVQKLVAEADKLFEKGKFPEGVAKLKAAISEEPLNQIVVTKLANVFIQNREPLEAAKVYGGLAKRLSDAGKNQVSIAIYKQALELAPDDISLRLRFAQECESIGKLGDAFLQGQIVVNYYLRRKKYFDASNILPLMARAQPKDDKIKMAWLEVLQLCQAEQKLIHFLVALCGPPGLVSQEFPQGGDPVALSPALYEGIKRLVPYFPRDPKVAYAVAWSAWRRGQTKDFYHFLHECLRREPDFCLGMLLFSRALAEDKKLNEALFVYRYYKERMTADKSADMLTLNRLMEAFVEKNGWIKFIEDSGDLLDTAGFVRVMTGQEQKVEDKGKEQVEAEAAAEKEKSDARGLDLPPAEIEIGGGGAQAEMEIVTATGQSINAVRAKKPQSPNLSDPMRMQAELIKATIEATVAGMGGAASQTQQTLVQPVVLPVIQAAAVQGTAQLHVSAPTISPEAIAQATAAAAKSLEAEPKPAAAPEKEAPSHPTAPTAPTAARKGEEDEEIDGFEGESVNFTSLIKVDRDALKAEAEAAAESPLPPSAPVAPPPPAAPLAATSPPPPTAPEPEEAIEGFEGESVNFTSLIKVDRESLLAEPASDAPTSAPNFAAEHGATQVAVAPPAGEKTKVAALTEQVLDVPASEKTMVAPAADSDRTKMQPLTSDEEGGEEAEAVALNEGGEESAPPAKKGFNPFEQSALADDPTGESLRLENEAEERTQMFSPIEVLDAAKVMQNRELGKVDTKKFDLKAEPAEESITTRVPPAPPDPPEIHEADKTKWRTLKPEGEKTVLFSPVDAVQAGVDSRRPRESTVKPAEPGKPPVPDVDADFTSGEATVIFQRPDLSVPDAAAESGEPAKIDGGTNLIAANSPEAEAAPGEAMELREPTKTPLVGDTPIPGDPGVAFMPIPTAAATARPGAGEEKVDLGDDLLEGPTRIFSNPTAADKTEHLIKEIKHDLKNKASARLNIDMLMKKAERYTAKRNYYLARKALRHAQALGADEETVKTRLREIRKLELPDGLYNAISSDQTEAKVDTSAVIERLEQEFDLTDGDGAAELGSVVSAGIESIFRESDPRTILDFGVGLHEMGLFHQAEALFIRLVEEFPDHAFDAYYLAAISKLSRRDYAGAASILKRLSTDNAKSDLEKIQIYYVLGETFEKMRQRDRSKKFFKKVAELDANYRNIRNKLGD